MGTLKNTWGLPMQFTKTKQKLTGVRQPDKQLLPAEQHGFVLT